MDFVFEKKIPDFFKYCPEGEGACGGGRERGRGGRLGFSTIPGILNPTLGVGERAEEGGSGGERGAWEFSEVPGIFFKFPDFLKLPDF